MSVKLSYLDICYKTIVSRDLPIKKITRTLKCLQTTSTPTIPKEICQEVIHKHLYEPLVTEMWTELRKSMFDAEHGGGMTTFLMNVTGLFCENQHNPVNN